MTSNFVWNGKTNTLKADKVTPSLLKRVFGIDNMMLTDEEGEPHFPERDKFEPSLTAEKSYTLCQISLPATNDNAEEKDQQVVALIKNAESSLQYNLSADSFVSENTGLLLNAIHAPFVINVLAVLSCLGPDPSLISRNMGIEKFKELKTPGSFRASICQVAHCVCIAYRTADSSMDGIRALLSDLPDYFARIFKMINDPNLNEGGQKTLKSQLSQVNRTNEKCKKLASNAHSSVSEVIKLLNELHQSSIALNSANAAEIREKEQRKIALTMEQSDRSKETAKLEKEAAETVISKNEAKKAHLKQLDNHDVLINILATSAAEGVVDYINGVGANKEMIKLATKVLNDNVLTQVLTKDVGVDTSAITKEMTLLQTLDIGTMASLKLPEAISSKILYLKEFEKNIFTTPEGIAIKKKVTEFIEILENNSTQDSEETLNSSFEGVKTSLFSAIENLAKTAQEKQKQQEKNKEAQYSLHQQFVKSDAEKTQTTQKLYEKECENAEKASKELSANKERMREIMIELQNVTVSTTDLTGCIRFLEKVLGHLSQVEENWSSLEKFFGRISNCVENILHRNVEEFAQHVENNYSTEYMLESAMKATACTIQLSNCAEIYMTTSAKLIMPVINGITKQLSLSPEEAKVKQLDVQIELEEAHKNLEGLLEDKQHEFNDRVALQIEDFVDKIKKALPYRQIKN